MAERVEVVSDDYITINLPADVVCKLLTQHGFSPINGRWQDKDGRAYWTLSDALQDALKVAATQEP